MSDGSPPRHYCDHFLCGKSFRRAEHLTRHKLNHTDATIPCPRCDRSFYRNDLLQRHLTLKHGRPSKTVRKRKSSSSQAQEAALQQQTTIQLQGEYPSPPGSARVDQQASHHQDVAMSETLSHESPVFAFGADWGWSPLPALPALPQVPLDPQRSFHIGPGMSEYGHEEWRNPIFSLEIHVSQQVHDYIASLPPLIEAGQSSTLQETSNVLNTAFAFVMSSIPIFYRPTFNFDLVGRELCCSFFCLGLLVAQDHSLHQLGCSLLSYVRTELLRHVNRSTITMDDLDIVQSMALVEYCGFYLADRPAIELGDIFHGSLVTLCRRLTLFDTSEEKPQASIIMAEDGLKDLLKRESAKRLAFFVFGLDVESALFFGHERSPISIHSMRVDMPSDEEGWQIPSDQPLQPTSSSSMYCTKLNVLIHNILTSPDDPSVTVPYLSQISNLIVLLGLTSVVLDLLQRRQDPFYDTTRALARVGAVLPVVHSRLMSGPAGRIKIHGRIVYHMAAIALCTPLDDLERATNNGFSRSGSSSQQLARGAIIRLLTKHKVGSEPARHAVQLLRLSLLHPSTPLHMATASNASVTSVSTSTTTTTTTTSAAVPGQASGILCVGGFDVSSPDCSPFETSSIYYGVLALWAYIIGRVGEFENGGNVVMAPTHPFMPTGMSMHASVPMPSFTTDQSIDALLINMETAIEQQNIVACRAYWRAMMPHALALLARRPNSNAQEYRQVLGTLNDSIGL